MELEMELAMAMAIPMVNVERSIKMRSRLRGHAMPCHGFLDLEVTGSDQHGTYDSSRFTVYRTQHHKLFRGGVAYAYVICILQ